jgi:flavodoxin
MPKISSTLHASRRRFIAPSLLLPLIAAVSGAVAAKPGAAAPRGEQGRILVACFSRSGNTRVIAGQIHRTYNAPLFDIEAAQPYPEDYLQTVAQAHQETLKAIRPALKAKVANLASYQTIFLGFPIWGETAPPIIRSFLAAHDFKGKTIIPFITHGGYGLGSSLKVLAADAPGANVLDAHLVMQADQERATMEKVNDWLGKLPKAAA